MIKEYTEESKLVVTVDIFNKPELEVLGSIVVDRSAYQDSINQQLKDQGLEPIIERGDYNGYVIISDKHPMYGKNYDEVNKILSELDLEIHGGLTYDSVGSGFKEYLENISGKYQVFGFDTAHIGDTRETWPKERFDLELGDLIDAFIVLGAYKE